MLQKEISLRDASATSVDRLEPDAGLAGSRTKRRGLKACRLAGQHHF